MKKVREVLSSFLLLFSPFQDTLADTLTNALSIVYTESATLSAKNRLLGLNISTSKWETDLRLFAGYSDKHSNEFAPGFDKRVMLTVKRPLFGGVDQTDKDRAQALSAKYEVEEKLLREFLAKMETLKMLKAKLDIAQSYHNNAVYQIADAEAKNKQAKAENRLHEIIDIQALADKGLITQEKLLLATIDLRAQVESVARFYGKTRWEELKILIEAYVRAMGGINSEIILEPPVSESEME